MIVVSFKCDADVRRNTAVDTVEQELLFVGSESGKLVAMRDIVKKVQTKHTAVYLMIREFSY